MSRIRTLGASLIAFTALSGAAAFAADIPDNYQAPPDAGYVPVQTFTWNGPYVGLFGGYDWANTSTSDTGDIGTNGWKGGAFVGYNFQVAPNWVFGLEGDYAFAGGSGSNATYDVSHTYDATVRARVGYTVDRVMFYGTGGVAFGNVDVDGGVVNGEQSKGKTGWTAGAGIEAALTDTVIGRIEYRHTDLGSSTYDDIVGAPEIGYSSNSILLGAGLKF